MQIKQTSSGAIAFCDTTPSSISTQWFTYDYWQKLSAITGSSKGRYTTWFVKPDTAETGESEWVLRHYYRGGLMEKLSKDAYLYTGLKHTRAVAELSLLELLYGEGFEVPKPIAANVERSGLSYRADIIIERVEGAQDLVAKLSKSPMSETQWQRLGACIAKFHQRGVYHADLNAKNILITDDKFYLIDFDRGEIRKPNPKWQGANLERLLRSFRKELAKLPTLAFSESNWQSLMQGYANP
ncbi:3-deoxy-D-manno-octulosonic acid kinase [Shewanella atlantica]|uniref:3-deoxy-D-manno-octulosonic acid kinase n=1 Tax=Shewanella atlantica TaxID=271099 RepID=UPI003735BA53